MGDGQIVSKTYLSWVDSPSGKRVVVCAHFDRLRLCRDASIAVVWRTLSISLAKTEVSVRFEGLTRDTDYQYSA